MKIAHWFSIVTRRPWLSATIGVLILGGGYLIFRPADRFQYETTIAQQADIIEEVSVTGRVQPAESVELAFEKSGRVAAIYASVGSRIQIGNMIVRLDNADLYAQLQQAEANVKAQQAKLDELKRGTRLEEIKIQEVQLQNAKTSLEDSKKNMVDKVNDAYTKSEDAIRNKVDQIFSNPRSASPQVNFSGGDSALEQYLESTRPTLEALFIDWNQSLLAVSLSSDLEWARKIASDNLTIIKNFLEKTALFINPLTPNSALSQATIDGYKTDISTARTNVNTAITNLSAAAEKWRSAESLVTLEENELLLKQAGTVPEQIAAQEAQVEQAIANVNNYQAQIAKTIIRSPINGIITKQDAKIGQIVGANTILTNVISDAKYEIEANVPEADIAKIIIGNQAKITLDAYGSDVEFGAGVVKIDPAETVIDGVSTYKITLQFHQDDNRLRSGMTANIDIETNRSNGAIVVPQRAVQGRNNERTVEILIQENGTEIVKSVPVKVGIRSSDGMVEILDGVQEGDRVVVNKK